MTRRRRPKAVLGSIVVLFLLAILSLAVVAIPFVMTANPLQYHSEELIDRLHLLDFWGPTITVGLLLLGLAVGYRLVRQRPGILTSIAVAVPLLVLGAAPFLARQHLIEWLMFAPRESVAFSNVSEAADLGDDTYVMAVSIGGESRAYPVPVVAYHHIINDEIDGVPFAVTW